jgi:hypothetical protein
MLDVLDCLPDVLMLDVLDCLPNVTLINVLDVVLLDVLDPLIVAAYFSANRRPAISTL